MARNKHHRRPRSLGGDSSRRNISYLDENQHYFYHRLFKNPDGTEMTVPEIVRLLTKKFIDPDWVICCQKRFQQEGG